MKVLNCISDSRFGGPHRRSFSIARELQAHNIDTLFLFGKKDDQPVQAEGFRYFLLDHIQMITRRAPLRNLLRFLLALPVNVLKIRRIIETDNIDIVHINGLYNVVPALAAAIARRPIIWHCNDNYVPEPLRKVLLPLLGFLADRIVIQGRSIGRRDLKNNAALWRKATVLYPGINAARFDPDIITAGEKQSLRAEFNIPEGWLLVGTIGSINYLKGHRFFIQAARQIKQQIGNVKFLIVGQRLRTTGRYWQRLQQQVQHLGLADDVIFTGFRHDIPQILSILDVFVLASIAEACPNALLEALAMKVPTVATDVGAVSEVTAGNAACTLVAPKDSIAIGRAVLHYLQKPPGQISSALDQARQRVENLFALDKIAQQQENIYRKLLSKT
jgi:glycosyltransferase involved in cell wall biosynthesis